MDHTTDSPLAMTRKERAHFLSFTEPLTRDVHPDAELTTIIGADTFDVVTARLNRMLAQRRNVTYLHRYLGRELEVTPLVVPVRAMFADEEGGNWYAAHGRRRIEWRGTYGLHANSFGGYSIWFTAAANVTAAENAARAEVEHADNGNPIAVTRVTIHGGDEGHDELAFGDHVIVERFNEFGVGEWTRIDFHPAPPRS